MQEHSTDEYADLVKATLRELSWPGVFGKLEVSSAPWRDEQGAVHHEIRLYADFVVSDRIKEHEIIKARGPNKIIDLIEDGRDRTLEKLAKKLRRAAYQISKHLKKRKTHG